MDREKLVEEMLAAAREWPTNKPISDYAMEAALTVAEAAIRAAEREACAKWHEEIAVGMRHVAETTRRDWCGPDIPTEDRRANHQDAREHDAKARWHDSCAAAIRARGDRDA